MSIEENIEFAWKGLNKNKLVILRALTYYKSSIEKFNVGMEELKKIKEAKKFISRTIEEGFEEGK